MIRKLAFNIANYIYKKENTTHAERYGYYYVLQWLLFQIFEVLITLAMSLIFGYVKEMLVVMIAIICLRVTKGGIHASSAKACLILTATLLNVCAILSKSISNYIGIDYIFIVTSIVISYLFIKTINSKYGSITFRKIENLIK